MSASRRTRRILAAALALAAAACRDSSAPESPLTDPAGLSAALTQISQPLETPVFASFSSLDASAGPLAGAGQAAALALAARTYALQSAGAPGAPSAPEAARAAALARLVPTFSVQAARDTFLPDTSKGTWEWDEVNNVYVKTGPPPIANTVRIILYDIDPTTDLPAEPVDEVGYVDITDNQPPPGQGLSVSLTVRDSAGTTTYVDYDATLTPGTSSFSATATGFVTNGLQGASNITLTFSTDFSASQTIAGSDTTTDVSADATVSLNQSVRAEVHDVAQVVAGANTITLSATRDFRFHRPGDVITVVGTLNVTVDPATGELISLSVDVTVRVNGGTLLARVVGTYPNVRVTGPGGREPTGQEFLAVDHLLLASDQVFAAITAFFDPLEEFFFN